MLNDTVEMWKSGERLRRRTAKTTWRLSWSGEGGAVQGDVASQREAGGRIQRLGKGVNELFHGAEVLALAVAEIHQTQAGKRKRVFFLSHGVVVGNSERVGVGHLGAVHCADLGEE